MMDRGRKITPYYNDIVDAMVLKRDRGYDLAWGLNTLNDVLALEYNVRLFRGQSKEDTIELALKKVTEVKEALKVQETDHAPLSESDI